MSFLKALTMLFTALGLLFAAAAGALWKSGDLREAAREQCIHWNRCARYFVCPSMTGKWERVANPGTANKDQQPQFDDLDDCRFSGHMETHDSDGTLAYTHAITGVWARGGYTVNVHRVTKKKLGTTQQSAGAEGDYETCAVDIKQEYYRRRDGNKEVYVFQNRDPIRKCGVNPASDYAGRFERISPP